VIASPPTVDGASGSIEAPSELVHLLQELEKSLIAMGADALRRSGGDLDIAVRFLVEDARNRLQRQVEESLRDFSNWLRLRAQSLPLRLFVDHLDTLAEAIEQRVQQLSSSSQPANAQLKRLRRDLGDFELLGLTPQVERLRREIVEFEARHKLLGDLISILRKAIAVVQEWRAKAEEVRRFLFALDRKVREELQSLPEPPEGTNFFGNNLKDLDALRTYLHERAYSLVKQKLPWDGTTDSDLQFITESICDALLEDVPAVTIDKWLSENEVGNLLKRLPIWAGIGEEKALLFNLPEPFIWAEVPQAIRKPIEERIESGLVTISNNSSVLIVHIFKHHPIQAIEDWEEWQLADEKVRQAFGGFAVNSAEPFAGEGDDVGT
jgi:hypothetical protein